MSSSATILTPLCTFTLFFYSYKLDVKSRLPGPSGGDPFLYAMAALIFLTLLADFKDQILSILLNLILMHSIKSIELLVFVYKLDFFR